MADDVVKVTRTCTIRTSELEWKFSPSGGPGGQHANTSNTKVEVRFDIASSGSLGPRQRSRLLERLGPVVRATASDERSQARNRDLAVDRLRSKLADALRQRPDRVATAPSASSRERRLQAKHHQSEKKRRRQPAEPDDG